MELVETERDHLIWGKGGSPRMVEGGGWFDSGEGVSLLCKNAIEVIK